MSLRRRCLVWLIGLALTAPACTYAAALDSSSNREKACREMDARGIRVKRTSSLWETEPMYVLEQDRFVNGACEVCSPCPRYDLILTLL